MKLVFHISITDTLVSLYFAHCHYIVEVLNNFWAIINLLKMKHNLPYIRNQSIPCCKHFPPQL